MDIEDFFKEKEKNKLKTFFLLDFKEGIVPAKSKREINVTFNPRDICNFKMILKAKVITNDPTNYKKF